MECLQFDGGLAGRFVLYSRQSTGWRVNKSRVYSLSTWSSALALKNWFLFFYPEGEWKKAIQNVVNAIREMSVICCENSYEEMYYPCFWNREKLVEKMAFELGLEGYDELQWSEKWKKRSERETISNWIHNTIKRNSKLLFSNQKSLFQQRHRIFSKSVVFMVSAV